MPEHGDERGYPPLELKVWGEWACFTRPEMKVERVTYPVMTPSAARGVLEAVFWKPEFDWRVREIWVLKPIRHFSILRNEVNRRAVAGGDEFLADDERTQRHTLGLREVAYLIRADITVKPGVIEDPAKYRDQFRRRAGRGQCFQRPFLGCREFAASFALPTGDECPIAHSEELGRMLFDLEFTAGEGGAARWGHRCAETVSERERFVQRGRFQPRFFGARLEQGVLRVPDVLYRAEAVA